MNSSERIDNILKIFNLNVKSFSEKIGLDRPQAIYDIRKGKTSSITEGMANKIISVFPEISRIWILTGEGSMLQEHEEKAAAAEDGKGEVSRLLGVIESQQRVIEGLVEELKRRG